VAVFKMVLNVLTKNHEREAQRSLLTAKLSNKRFPTGSGYKPISKL